MYTPTISCLPCAFPLCMTKQGPEAICVIGGATTVKVDAIQNYRLIRKMRRTSGDAASRITAAQNALRARLRQ